MSCDVPFGPVQEGVDAALRAAIRLVKEGGADMLKLDGAAEFPEAVRALTRAGIPVFAQFGLTPQTAMKYGIPYSAQASAGAQATAEMAAKLVEEAKMLEDAGAVCLDFTNSGPIAGAAVVKAVQIPVIASGGAGSAQHFVEVFGAGKADAALAASIFHFGVTDSRALKTELRRAGVRPRDLKVAMELGLQESAKAAVEAGYGVSFLSQLAVERELRLGTLATAEVAGIDPFRDFSTVRASGGELSRTTAAFVAWARIRLEDNAG